MKKTLRTVTWSAVLVVAPGLILVGCKKDGAGTGAGSTTAAASAPSPAIEAKLARADALDGTTDKIVSKCATCKLQMDGKAEHALTEAGYTLHFCSEGCRTEFSKDAAANILALDVPE